ncbi:helix-turn-helix domain-containing protein [Natronorubrum sp. FCH18a]|uniref:helix-turn-helix domain-containing protein n=1 Tax=Natronorubrum sp. FCH18a TaxID=3447018 RepID=UPI003F5143BF
MSVIVKLRVPTDDFLLEDALDKHRSTTVELEQLIPVQKDIFPLFFAWGCENHTQFEELVRKEPEVDQLTTVEQMENGVLYRVDWAESAEYYCQAITQTNASLLQGVGTHEDWYFELRFMDSADVSVFHNKIKEIGVQFEVETVYQMKELGDSGYHGLTHRQRETLISAYEEGYYDEPREVTLSELGEKHNVSSGAIRGRLRRGISTLIEHTLLKRI